MKGPSVTYSKICFVLISSMLIFLLTSNEINGQLNAPIYSQFVYEGHDQVYKVYPLEEGESYSPILQGTYPDPAIVRRGEDYFMVHSSFTMWPGIPIFHSNDLVNWTQIGHVLDRPSQLFVQDYEK